MNTAVSDKSDPDRKWRQSSENLLPQNLDSRRKQPEGYDIYPFRSLGAGKIHNGYSSLARWIISQKNVIIDGYIGAFWDEIQKGLDAEFAKLNIQAAWHQVDEAQKSASEIEKLVAPFTGDPGAVWGTKASLELAEFFDSEMLNRITIDTSADVNIAIGIGASLIGWDAPLVYVDIPKNEIQYRSRAGTVTNLGSDQKDSASDMYKRFYFVDWPVLNAHKERILNDITVVADAQWKDSLNWILSTDLTTALKALSHSVFRVRPWFEAGAWGGHWMQERFAGLNKNAVNYAWSFELIVPENGLIFESDGNLLEISFDFLMFAEKEAVLGKHAAIFGSEFPIRFDFLDTVEGGNLSIQCHPSVEYIRKEFGENITQDETYYILDCREGANVYLGFQENIIQEEFEQALEHSQESGTEIDITKYVQSHPAKKHDLFLIPNGTIHSAGADNLVLEISATPYIFTFKMYDWMRPGLDGNPRPINIDHAFKNLNFKRKGKRVEQELISKQVVIDQRDNWQIVHCPTHAEHFYDVHRIEFDGEINIPTNNSCHILMLVEGTAITVTTADGTTQNFSFAETFVIPASATSYRVVNHGNEKAKLIKAFLKDEIYPVLNHTEKKS